MQLPSHDVISTIAWKGTLEQCKQWTGSPCLKYHVAQGSRGFRTILSLGIERGGRGRTSTFGARKRVQKIWREGSLGLRVLRTRCGRDDLTIYGTSKLNVRAQELQHSRERW